MGSYGELVIFVDTTGTGDNLCFCFHGQSKYNTETSDSKSLSVVCSLNVLRTYLRLHSCRAYRSALSALISNECFCLSLQMTTSVSKLSWVWAVTIPRERAEDYYFDNVFSVLKVSKHPFRDISFRRLQFSFSFEFRFKLVDPGKLEVIWGYGMRMRSIKRLVNTVWHSINHCANAVFSLSLIEYMKFGEFLPSLAQRMGCWNDRNI